MSELVDEFPDVRSDDGYGAGDLARDLVYVVGDGGPDVAEYVCVESDECGPEAVGGLSDGVGVGGCPYGGAGEV